MAIIWDVMRRWLVWVRKKLSKRAKSDVMCTRCCSFFSARCRREAFFGYVMCFWNLWRLIYCHICPFLAPRERYFFFVLENGKRGAFTFFGQRNPLKAALEWALWVIERLWEIWQEQTFRKLFFQLFRLVMPTYTFILFMRTKAHLTMFLTVRKIPFSTCKSQPNRENWKPFDVEAKTHFLSCLSAVFGLFGQ